jgi:hypothetical protein
MLDQELDYFKEHQDELVEEHEGEFLVIKGEEVIGVYDTELDAYEEASKDHEPGTFLIQQALPGDDAYTQTFHSRVRV